MDNKYLELIRHNLFNAAKDIPSPVCRAEHWLFYLEQSGKKHGEATQEASGIRVGFLLNAFLWLSKDEFAGSEFGWL